MRTAEMRRWIRSVGAILRKDIQSELRTRYAISALVMFVVTTIAVLLFALGQEDAPAEVLAGTLWIVIFFGAMSGLSRTFVMEEERGTSMTLQLLAALPAVTTPVERIEYSIHDLLFRIRSRFPDDRPDLFQDALNISRILGNVFVDGSGRFCSSLHGKSLLARRVPAHRRLKQRDHQLDRVVHIPHIDHLGRSMHITARDRDAAHGNTAAHELHGARVCGTA